MRTARIPLLDSVVMAEEPRARSTDSDDEVGEEYRLRRAAEDAALEPWALLKAVRDSAGRVVDFVYHDINVIAARQQRLQPQDLVGRSLIESLPQLVPNGIFEKYVHCIDTGEPLFLDDLSYFGRTLDGLELQTHRYEMRGVRVETEYLSLSWRDIDQRYTAVEQVRQAQETLRASADAMLDPQVVLEAVRDSSGRIVDFLYRDVNKATCDYLGLSREDLVGRGVVALMPGIATKLFGDYVRCLETGEPVILNDFSYDNEILAESRRYDLRVTRATSTSLVLTWRDVTDRFRTIARIEHSEALLRASADSMIDPQMLLEAVRDPETGRVVDFIYREANAAACQDMASTRDELIGRTVLELLPSLAESGLLSYYAQCVETGQPGALDDYPLDHDVQDSSLRYDIRIAPAGNDFINLTFRNVTDRFQAAQRLMTSEQNYRLLAENAGDLVVHIRDGRFAWVSPSCSDVIGGSPDYWVGRDATEITVPVEEEIINASTETVEAGGVVQVRHRVQAMDGTIHWVHVRAAPFCAPDGQEDGIIASLRVVDDEVAAEQAAEKARREKERDDERYRRSIDNAAVGMCMVTPDGHLYDINKAGCRFFGYDAQELMGKRWQEITAPEYLEGEQHSWDGILEGRIDSYRLVKHYQHADGHRIWGDLSVSGIRDDAGEVEHMVALITDITARVEADERNLLLAQRLQHESDRVKAELESAAAYMSSIMPHGLEGRVKVSSRYLPSQQLGGDCLDYYWLDDDHLLIKLIDVSGHGLEPALLAVSVHNLMRSGSLTPETLLSPEAVLAELNQLFTMDEQNDHYITMWYGIYTASTRTLRYASAGAPPALAFNSTTGGTVEVTELITPATPIGMFTDTEFTSRSYPVPLGCRLLICSDGANEIDLNDGKQLSLQGFKELATRLARSPNWSLDQLIEELQALGPSESFDDDCSLIQLTFD